MSYVKHPAPWIGAVLFLLTALSDAERDYSIPFAVVVGWLFGAFCLWLYRYIVASRKERAEHPQPTKPKKEKAPREPITLPSLPKLPKRQKVVLVRTFIVTEDSRRSASSAAMRGVLGTTLSVVNPAAGVVGAAAGVMSGKNKKTTTFVLEYSDGHRETKTVKNGSKEYNHYCTLLERRL